MADTPNERRVIAYWDFENLVRSLPDDLAHFERARDGGRAALKKVADFVQERGYVFINRSFANWPLFGKQGDTLKKLGVEVIAEVSVASNGKNGADIQLVIDAVQTVCSGSSRIEEAVLLTGDSDFVPLAIFLRSKGIKVIGMSGSASASRLWREQCDEFFLLEDILGIPHVKKAGERGNNRDRDKGAGGNRSASAKTYKVPDRVRRRMVAIVGEAQDDAPKPGVNAGAVLQQLQAEFPRFDYKKLGAERWSDVVKSLTDYFAYDYTDDKIPQLCIRTRKPYKPRRKSSDSAKTTKKTKSREAKSSSSSKASGSGSRSGTPSSKSGRLLSDALAKLMEQSDEGFVVPARLGHMLKQLDEKFDTKTYGHASLKEFIVAHTGEAAIEEHDRHGYVIRPVKSSSRGRGSHSSSREGTSRDGARRDRSDTDSKKLPRPQMQSIERYMRSAARDGKTWSDEHALYKAYRNTSRTRISEQDFWAFVKRRQWVIQDVNGEVRAKERPSREDRAKRSSANEQVATTGNGNTRSGGRNGRSQERGRVKDPADNASSTSDKQTQQEETSTDFFGKVRRFFGSD